MDFGDVELLVLAKRLARDVRRRLDEAGHAKVAMDEHLVRFAPTHGGRHELSVNVPLGAALVLPLKALESRANGDPERLLSQFAADLAKALPNAVRASGMLEAYIAKVRRVALREISAARRLGADLQLADVAPKPTYAWHMTHPDWRDAAHHVLAQMAVRRLDLALRPDIDEFIVEEADHVAAEIARRRDEQIARQARRTDLRVRGADLQTDVTTVRILERFGLDAADALRRVEADQIFQVAVEEDGRVGHLFLLASEGKVGSTLDIEGRPRWVDGLLEFRDDMLDAEHPPEPGRPLGPQAGLPILRGLVTSHVKRYPHDRMTIVHVNMKPILFDGLSGRTWAEERLAA